MIPVWATVVLIVLGFACFAGVGALLRWQRPSLHRLEWVLTLTPMGAALVVLGTAQLVCRAVEKADRSLAEAIVVASVSACMPLCVVGRPLVRWWASRRAPGVADYAEDRRGNAVRVSKE